MTEGKEGCGCGQSGMHAHEGADREKKEPKIEQGSQRTEKEGEGKEQGSKGLADEGIKKGTGS